jgi:hypothetical protein
MDFAGTHFAVHNEGAMRDSGIPGKYLDLPVAGLYAAA